MWLAREIFSFVALLVTLTDPGRAERSSRRMYLDGEWQIRDMKSRYNLTGQVPGGIYTDLMNAGIIDDILYGYNDNNTNWVQRKNWTYTKRFIVKEEFKRRDRSKQSINLVLEGVDTFSSIYLNKKYVGSTENMFVQYVFDVQSLLKVGKNILEVKFLSPIEKAKQLYDRQASHYEVPPKCILPENGECHVNHIRKMQASFGWDWGPAFPSVGIWKPVYLESYEYAIIRYVSVDNRLDTTTQRWYFAPLVIFSNPISKVKVLRGNITFILDTDFTQMESFSNVNVAADSNGEYTISRSMLIPMTEITLWWPNGYGSQKRYNLRVTFQSEYGGMYTKFVRVAFRSVDIIQEPVKGGATFYFLINNVPIFAKGTNLIPLNILPEKGQDREKIKYLLQSAKAANMNMIRVWGGGVYESDALYNIADKLGIMIWQDFMFACGMYPTNQEFIRSVQLEVRHQIRRLRNHPSIVVWAGNNENEAALRQNWYGTSNNFERYRRDYVKLYVDTIREEVIANDISRPFLVSSPTNGRASERQGYIAQDPQSRLYGDIHHYDYMTDPWKTFMYPVSRFVSEYGLQSFPFASTLLTATNNVSDLRYNSDFMNHRQHRATGTIEIKTMIDRELVLPCENNPYFDEAFIYYSQIIQAVGIKRQTEYYRIQRNKTDSTGQGLTMGALYWQLNDVWQAPSWAGIDFKGKWKMLHYYARDFFAPVIIGISQTASDTVSVHVVSDQLINTTNNVLTVSVYKYATLGLVAKTTVKVDINAYSTMVHSVWMDKYLSDAGCGTMFTAVYKCFLHLTLKDDRANRIAPDNFLLPSSLTKANLTSTNVTVLNVEQMGKEGEHFKVFIKTNATALFVWLDSGNVTGTFSENGFMQVIQVKIIYFHARPPTRLNTFKSSLTLTHLRDSRYF